MAWVWEDGMGVIGWILDSSSFGMCFVVCIKFGIRGLPKLQVGEGTGGDVAFGFDCTVGSSLSLMASPSSLAP